MKLKSKRHRALHDLLMRMSLVASLEYGDLEIFERAAVESAYESCDDLAVGKAFRRSSKSGDD